MRNGTINFQFLCFFSTQQTKNFAGMRIGRASGSAGNFASLICISQCSLTKFSVRSDARSQKNLENFRAVCENFLRNSTRMRATFGTRSDDDSIFELCILQSAIHMLEERSHASKVCGASRKVLKIHAKFRGVFERFGAQILRDVDAACEAF